MMIPDEPSVLDYLKSLLRGKPLPIPLEEPTVHELPSVAVEAVPQQVPLPVPDALPEVPAEYSAPDTLALAEPPILPAAAQPEAVLAAAFPWRSLAALALALLAQSSLEPVPDRTWKTGVLLYLGAAVFGLWALWKREWRAQLAPEKAPAQSLPFLLRPAAFLISLPFALTAFLSFGGNRFTSLNLLLWVIAIFFMTRAFWEGSFGISAWFSRSLAWVRQPPWKLALSPWSLLLVAAVGIVLFFRVSQISQVPLEMVSDQAEKLLDVYDVLQGQTSIFFPRNTGREALQMYLTAAVIRWLGTGITFLSLKLGTVLAGLLTLPYLYLLGKEIGSRWVGLLAFVFAGIAYWPNVISRVGLRFPLYPLFVAPALYFLIRGLRRSQRNDFILAGLALGIGLHGYTPIRILPFVILAAVGLFLLHRQPPGAKRQALLGLLILGVMAFLAFLPLFRYSLDNPELFGYRAFTRLGSVERPLPGPAWEIFLKNLWNALIMFGWSDGNIWVHSVTGRPALDVVSAALYHLGLLLVFVRYLRHRNWLDLFLLLSIPLLMMPSILSLAFPDENPALNRAAGAMVPVFIVLALAFESLLSGFKKPGAASLPRWTWALGLFLFTWSAVQNYDLVFNQYRRAYEGGSWNTSEMGQVIHDFGVLFGSTDNAWVVAYPHWVDTRLVGMNAGVTTRDFAVFPEQLPDTASLPGPKLFLVKPEDQVSLDLLKTLYPAGALQTYESKVEKDFLLYWVTPGYQPLEAAPLPEATPEPEFVP